MNAPVNESVINPVAEPLAHVFGEPVLALPSDLYIPPDALRVLLESFEGPLDLLLYLIRKQNVDILDIPMAAVTSQYMQYVEAMKSSRLELAAEYLLMAALLIEIKSRMLLPKTPASEEGEADDPRAELVRRLLEYEQIKLAAFELDQLPQAGRDFLWAFAVFERELVDLLPEVRAADLKAAWLSILTRARNRKHHTIATSEISVREQMSHILRVLEDGRHHDFVTLFDHVQGVPLLVVTFSAVLELVKEKLIRVSQAGFDPETLAGEAEHAPYAGYAPIYVSRPRGVHERD
ncbi:segregation and condensation protein A [Chitinilyticum piscinae]|uniref:Segregation and condensation protein A n=1 Tax=Chitinilyticum piscinae TaxID=2866724 RepID=A0A8J7FND1_9NEIS|nr:ScpA family protein [Chitinilyticum piscinae]MBE9609314.1 segregation/condensation protein A [Chitinilyticum piscinae]